MDIRFTVFPRTTAVERVDPIFHMPLACGKKLKYHYALHIGKKGVLILDSRSEYADFLKAEDAAKRAIKKIKGG